MLRVARHAVARAVADRQVRIRLARVGLAGVERRRHPAGAVHELLEIGDAPAVRAKTVVLYPAFRRATAQRLAAQFGFAELKPFNGSEIVVLLGRDAAAMKSLRRA